MWLEETARQPLREMSVRRIPRLPIAILATILLFVGAGTMLMLRDEAGAAPSSNVVVGIASASQIFRGQPRQQMGSNVAPGGHSFYFTRGMYSGRGWRSGWATDAPDADRWIINVISRLTLLDVYPRENYVALDDPELRRFPFLYILEVSSMGLTDAEVQGLRDYLLAGGFLMVDDFWGTAEWAAWEREIRAVLPEYDIVDIPLDHPIFATVYQVDEVVQVPSIGNARRGVSYERDGIVPHLRGIFDEKGRLMVAINWNTDIGDAWEWAEDPSYPVQYSTYAYQMAANFFIYAMTH